MRQSIFSRATTDSSVASPRLESSSDALLRLPGSSRESFPSDAILLLLLQERQFCELYDPNNPPQDGRPIIDVGFVSDERFILTPRSARCYRRAEERGVSPETLQDDFWQSRIAKRNLRECLDREKSQIAQRPREFLKAAGFLGAAALTAGAGFGIKKGFETYDPGEAFKEYKERTEALVGGASCGLVALAKKSYDAKGKCTEQAGEERKEAYRVSREWVETNSLSPHYVKPVRMKSRRETSSWLG